MIDAMTNEGRIITAALALAAEKRWADVTLWDIAERASVALVDLKSHFGSKGDILTAYTRLVDDEVLRRVPKRAPGLGPRDALFDVIMGRFDVLAPHKRALKSIAADAVMDPSRVAPFVSTQRWMLKQPAFRRTAWTVVCGLRDWRRFTGRCFAPGWTTTTPDLPARWQPSIGACGAASRR